MSHLTDQFLKEFLQDIQKDETLASSLKEKINHLYLTKKIAKSQHLKNLLNTFSLDSSKINDENTKN